MSTAPLLAAALFLDGTVMPSHFQAPLSPHLNGVRVTLVTISALQNPGGT